MNRPHLVITSIAGQNHPVLKHYAVEATKEQIPFLVVGDRKSPASFDLPGCDFYSAERQQSLPLSLAQLLPWNHYARKNLGYLAAMLAGAEVIIETDDDNLPFAEFWTNRNRMAQASELVDCGWVNVYKYFSDAHIWPRGFALDHLHDQLPSRGRMAEWDCPIQQGLATRNPDVDALYRLTLPLPIEFKQADSVALGRNSFCPFNSQNTTWFRPAFALLYLPSYCSFRMTDIWRSFIAQRIAWECGWNILFHSSTVWQERNDHNLLTDFRDEIPGYLNNQAIFIELKALKLLPGPANIAANLISCYTQLIAMGLIDGAEMPLLNAWLADLNSCGQI